MPTLLLRASPRNMVSKETFAPKTKITFVMVLIAPIVARGWLLYQLDVYMESSQRLPHPP